MRQGGKGQSPPDPAGRLNGPAKVPDRGQPNAERLQLVFDQAAVGIELVDRDGRLLDVNAAVCTHARLCQG